MIEMTAEEVRRLTNGELRGRGDRRIRGVATLEKASTDALSFIASARYLPYLQATRAGVVLVNSEWAPMVPPESTAVVVDDPHGALQSVLGQLYPPRDVEPGIHPTAVVAEGVEVPEDVAIGPFSVVGADCRIGRRVQIGAHSVIGQGCRIGEDVRIHPHVTLYEGVVIGDRTVIHSGARVGKEGFGFVWKEGGHRRIPQIGGCLVESDVEVGANVTIDRGSVGDTVIGAGTKIDNLVHIGHNVRIGKHALLIAQVGISGSSTIGDGAILAGQVGVSGHLEIGAGARLGAQAGVISDVPPGETWSGYPARPHREALRAQAHLFRLPSLLERLKRIEEALFPRAPK